MNDQNILTNTFQGTAACQVFQAASGMYKGAFNGSTAHMKWFKRMLAVVH